MEQLRTMISGWLDPELAGLSGFLGNLIYMVLLVFVVVVGARVWVATSAYWRVRADLLERTKRSLDKHELSIPLEQRALQIAASAVNK